MANPRKLAVSALLKVELDTAYSNITLNNEFHNSDATREDKALATAIFYGVLDRKITLDYVLSGFMKTPLKKVAPFTLQVLRSGLYQIMYMDKIPESAAVDESVKLIKKSKESRNSGFVNAVLRNAARAESLIPEGDSLENLSVRFSCPEWIIEGFISDYGIESAKALLNESLKPAPLTIRVNTAKITAEELKNKLEKLHIPFEDGHIDNSLVLKKGIDISENVLYKSGYFYAQDIASQTAVTVLAPTAGERVLDMCAAPGGKTFTIAQLMDNRGEIISCDLYEQRVNLIGKSAERLGLSIIKPLVSDACLYNAGLGKFDCILCDVPCSGLGILRRKPDIKYKSALDFMELCDIQYNILSNAVRYLKPGGRILYSTCTLRHCENEDIVARFLSEHSEFDKMYEHSYMPHIDKTDGFYCALLVHR